MRTERERPYVYVTWLTKLLVGENSCEWAAWFKAHYKDYDQFPTGFDRAGWRLAHTTLSSRLQDELEKRGQTVFTEDQNKFTLRGKVAVFAGKPDLIALYGTGGAIFDAKTGKPQPSHIIQVITYMYAVPRALPQYKDCAFDGKVVYADHVVDIPSSAVDNVFIDNLGRLIRRVGASSPARRVPSHLECGFCPITNADCTARAQAGLIAVAETDDF
ncbi:MAG: hypothetical protein EXR50_04905 [Dehalococcoidia bacterium]|nr:hypothetical protein [Dehalococcoidia bacterium]